MKLNVFVFALAVVASPAFAISKIVGTVESVDLENSTYKIIEEATGKSHELTFKSNSKVKINSRHYQDLSVLNVGDEVIYKAKQAKDVAASGTISSFEMNVIIKSVDIENNLITFIEQRTQKEKTLKFDASKAAEFAAFEEGESAVLGIKKTQSKISSL